MYINLCDSNICIYVSSVLVSSPHPSKVSIYRVVSFVPGNLNTTWVKGRHSIPIPHMSRTYDRTDKVDSDLEISNSPLLLLSASYWCTDLNHHGLQPTRTHSIVLCAYLKKKINKNALVHTHSQSMQQMCLSTLKHKETAQRQSKPLPANCLQGKSHNKSRRLERNHVFSLTKNCHIQPTCKTTRPGLKLESLSFICSTSFFRRALTSL